MKKKELHTKILDYLKSNPNVKAYEISKFLEIDKSLVNSALYGALNKQVIQDKSYKWQLIDEKISYNNHSKTEEITNTNLSNLCNYYLSCLGYDETGVSTFLTSKYENYYYYETNEIPNNQNLMREQESLRTLRSKKRSEQGRHEIFFGYPSLISEVKSQKSDWSGLMLEPVILFQIDYDINENKFVINDKTPIINQKAFKSFTKSNQDELMSHLAELESEIGFSEENQDIDIDEIALRLQSIRPEWPWAEKLNIQKLKKEKIPINAIEKPGIYNRAVFMLGEKSPFTQGLEQEIKELEKISSKSLDGTALDSFLNPTSKFEKMEEVNFENHLLEVLPMNSEQRDAVFNSLNLPISIITGPPGTGKSQVITNLILNAAWTGKRVLFASKNNKAVDIVEQRINSLGSKPILLRVGSSKAYQTQLAEYVLDLLSSSTTEEEKEDFLNFKQVYEDILKRYNDLDIEISRFIDLRNEVDRSEQMIQESRDFLSEKTFNNSKNLDLFKFKQVIKEIDSKFKNTNKINTSFFNKIFWSFVKDKKQSELISTIKRNIPIFNIFGIDLEKNYFSDQAVTSISTILTEALDIITKIELINLYKSKLSELQKLEPLEKIYFKKNSLIKEISILSSRLWKLWLRIKPSEISDEERQKLSKYTTLLKMIIDTGSETEFNKSIFSQYARMLSEISHYLPCWAVTSLSAKGKIPFSPGIFDIVVFDEASQCDIASALPLLYRAKSAVIIGDPKQLSHITSLKKGQDQNLLEKNGLLENFSNWSYSFQSLFGLSNSLVSNNDIIRLVDHHRSHAQIIEFSNQEFYEDRLRVATNYDQLKLLNEEQTGVKWIDIKGKVFRPETGGAVNQIEGEKVYQCVKDILINKSYTGTIGVVSPFRGQANLIRKFVENDKELFLASSQSKFISDTVHKFQGDERDLIIFSPVMSNNFPPSTINFFIANGNLFNVAITRARAQLIIVGDLKYCLDCNVGYLSRFAKYASSLKKEKQKDEVINMKGLTSQYPEVSDAELVSEWEKYFYKHAFKRGVRLMPQYQIEKFTVDFLMVHKNRKLVIEVDGERYHRNWTGELCRRDQLRNQRLFELGYDVIRFWVYEIRDDLDGCFQKLKNWQFERD